MALMTIWTAGDRRRDRPINCQVVGGGSGGGRSTELWASARWNAILAELLRKLTTAEVAARAKPKHAARQEVISPQGIEPQSELGGQ